MTSIDNNRSGRPTGAGPIGDRKRGFLSELLLPSQRTTAQKDAKHFHRARLQWLELTELQADARPTDSATTS
ncbi:hypothetical protein [Sulfuritalea sp.]|uniref:hypothetical protein n=1 Tax=Sulfuritalea sp. TaxID=2480090 RepID=UPI00286DFD9D|nr:hypothetical protein [Sulfuritalea sp.]